MLPILQIGSLAIQTSNLLILIGVYFGLSLAEKLLPKGSYIKEHLVNILISSMIVGILAARIGYALQNLSIISRSPRDLISLDPSLLDPISGIVLSALLLFVLLKRRGIDHWIFFDAITPALAVFSVTLGLAHLASGAAFGTPTTLAWGIDLWGTNRHPTQIYETILSISIFALFWRSFRSEGTPGLLFLKFIATSTCAFLFLDHWREADKFIFSGFRFSQIISWSMLAISFILLEMRYKKNQTPPEKP